MKLSSREGIWRIGTLFAFIAISGASAFYRPEILADNRFLDEFMGPDLIAVLIIVLTITFASVANVHLAITRMVSRAPDRVAADRVAGEARREINSNAWTIFWALMCALIALFFNGEFPKDKIVDALTTAACLTVVLLNGLVMHDIYQSIFMLVASERAGTKDGEGQDYSTDSTPV
jgi:hypothetical protein